MSTPVTYVGNSYNVPAYQDTGYAQGTGNLSSYLIALATGSLTLSGGTFTLTADVDFGGSFGLKSIYYKSRATNLSTTGVLRLGNTEVVGWRNAANGANLSLTSDSNNYLSYDGNGIVLTATTNQIKLGTSNIVTITSPAPSVSRTYTIPDAGGTASFVMTEGTKTVNGVTTFGNQIILPNGLIGTPSLQIGSGADGIYRITTNNLGFVANGTAVFDIGYTGGAAFMNLTVGPKPNTDNSISLGDATHRFSDFRTVLATVSTQLIIPAVTNQVILGTTNTTTITSTAPAASRVYTIPDAGGAASFVLSAGTKIVSGVTTFDTQLIGKGTTTNDSAAAGYIGEWINSDITSSQNFPSTGVWGDLTSISLTAGDWDVQGLVFAQANGATVTIGEIGISSTSGNNAPTRGPLSFGVVPPTAVYSTSGAIPSYRFSLSGTTTVYLKYYAEYSVATPKAFGTISGRRRR